MIAIVSGTARSGENVVPMPVLVEQEVRFAPQLVDDDALDDVHAHPAAARGRHLVAGRQARAAEEIEQSHVGRRQVGAGARRDARAVDAAAIVADQQLEHRVRALMRC